MKELIGWKTIKEEIQSRRKKDTFIRLENDGDRVSVVFLGEPHCFEAHRLSDCYLPCEGTDTCPHCINGIPSCLRIRINVFDEDKGHVRIFEGSTYWFRELDLIRDTSSLDNRSFEIRREGFTKDGDPNFLIFRNGNIPEARAESIYQMPLYDLSILHK